MIGYLSGILAFLLYAYWIIQTYSALPDHVEKASGFGRYIITALILWGIYKAWTLWGAQRAKDESIQVPRWILPASLFVLLIVAVLIFFNATAPVLASKTPVLVAKIIGWSLLPTLCAFVFHGLGKRLVSWAIPQQSSQHWQVWTLLAMASGWGVFLAAWTTLGVVGLLSGWAFFVLVGVAIAVSWRQILESLKWWGGSWRHEPSAIMRNLTSEWFFIVLSFTFLSNIINIVRPMPIGWDDLGVYMNVPKLMAQAGAIFAGSGMVAWQTYTSIGFLLGSPTQAFFLSCLGGVLGTMACWLAISHTLRHRRLLVDIPLLMAAVLYVMPMLVFQQAKDMKVDMGLLAITVGAVYPLVILLLGEIKSGRWKKVVGLSDDTEKEVMYQTRSWRPYLLIGAALGTAFAIKATTLMTFLGVFALLAMVAGGWSAFLGWNMFVCGVFTLGNLWKTLNVPLEPGVSVTQAGIAFSVAGVTLLGWSFFKNFSSWRKGGWQAFIAISAGIFLTLSPWLVKNTVEIVSTHQPVSMNLLLSGYDPQRDPPDLSKIYTSEQITEKKNEEQAALKAKEGQTSNEDLGRYIGYELGLNNYAKLPWNMTMQVNQKGEFTNITYLYLVLIPGSLLFLVYRRKWLVGVVILAIAGAYPLFIWQPNYFVPGASSIGLVQKYSQLFVQDPPSQSPNVWRQEALMDSGATVYERSVEWLRGLVRPVVRTLTPASWRDSFYDLPLDHLGVNGPGAAWNVSDFVGKMAQDSQVYIRTGILPEAPAEWSSYDKATYLALIQKMASVSFAPNVSVGSLQTDARISDAQDKQALLALRAQHQSLSQRITDILSVLELPQGYVWLALVALLVLGFLWWATSATGSYAEMRAHAAFAAPYILLYGVSAFAIPWYGIMMYVSFLLIAAFGLAEMSRDDGSAPQSWERLCRLVGAFTLLLATSVYFISSSIPHAINNLKSAGWPEYKAGLTTTEEETLNPRVRAGYLEILSALNLKDSARPLADIVKRYGTSTNVVEQNLVKQIVGNNLMDASTATAGQFLFSIRDQLRSNAQYALSVPVVEKALQGVLHTILYPSVAERNEAPIFRLGTFMTYHISQNLKRYWDDSLLIWFDRYIADENPDVMADRMKKLGFTYLLADLNAATIDVDPRHDLTRRYEGLLWSFSSKNLELIQTDNLCIRVAREISDLTKDQFIALTGINYESYTSSGTKIPRAQKRENCINFIAGLIADGRAASIKPLTGFAKTFSGVTDVAVLNKELQPYIPPTTWMAVFKIK